MNKFFDRAIPVFAKNRSRKTNCNHGFDLNAAVLTDRYAVAVGSEV